MNNYLPQNGGMMSAHSFFTHSDQLKILKSTTDKIDELNKQSLTLYHHFCQKHQYIEDIHYPEYKILDSFSGPAKTGDVSSCCVFILYSTENPKYIFGHFNSIEHLDSGRPRHLFIDVFSEIFTVLTSKGAELSQYKAILIGGDGVFFDKTRLFLEKHRIQISASYCDRGSPDSPLNEALYVKQVVFDPETTTTHIYSAVFKQGYHELKPQQELMLKRDLPDEYLSALALTCQHLEELGITQERADRLTVDEAQSP